MRADHSTAPGRSHLLIGHARAWPPPSESHLFFLFEGPSESDRSYHITLLEGSRSIYIIFWRALKVIDDLYSQCLTQILSKIIFFSSTSMEGVVPALTSMMKSLFIEMKLFGKSIWQNDFE